MGKIDFSDLDIQTQKGRDAARKRLTAYARTHTFSELSQVTFGYRDRRRFANSNTRHSLERSRYLF